MDVDEDDQSSRHCQMEVVSFFFFWQLRRTRNQDGDATAPHSRQITRHNRQDTHTHTRSMHHADTTRPLSTHRTPLDLPKKNAVHPGSEEALSSSRSVTAFGSVVPNLGLKNWTVGPRSTAMAGSRFGISGWGSLSRGGSWSQTAISQRERERERTNPKATEEPVPGHSGLVACGTRTHMSSQPTQKTGQRFPRGTTKTKTNKQTNKQRKETETHWARGGGRRGAIPWWIGVASGDADTHKDNPEENGHGHRTHG